MKLSDKNKIRLNIKDIYLENILPRFKEERIRAFLTLASTLLAISIFGFFAINPTLTTIAQLKKQLSDSQYVDQKLVEKISNLSTLQQSYSQIQDSLPTVLIAIPADPSMAVFIGQIQSIGQSSHITLNKIETLPVDLTAGLQTNGYTSFGFTIEANGTPANGSNFILQIQKYNRLITLDGFSVIQAPDNPNFVQIEIKGKAYYKKT